MQQVLRISGHCPLDRSVLLTQQYQMNEIEMNVLLKMVISNVKFRSTSSRFLCLLRLSI